MNISHSAIPREFLHALPVGIKFVSRRGKDFLVIEKLLCPNRHPLMAEEVCIHGEPSIRTAVRIGDTSGHIYIDSYWGSHNKLYDFIPDLSRPRVEVMATCPLCQASLMVDEPCRQSGCGCRRHILLSLPGLRNRIFVCGRLGCPGHRIDIAEAPRGVNEQISRINYFGNQTDDYFGGI